MQPGSHRVPGPVRAKPLKGLCLQETGVTRASPSNPAPQRHAGHGGLCTRSRWPLRGSGGQYPRYACRGPVLRPQPCQTLPPLVSLLPHPPQKSGPPKGSELAENQTLAEHRPQRPQGQSACPAAGAAATPSPFSGSMRPPRKQGSRLVGGAYGWLHVALGLTEQPQER